MTKPNQLTTSHLEHDIVLSATNVVKRFGDQIALDDVTLNVSAGEAVGLLGPNGSGKTTLISLWAGLRAPDSGAVRMFGDDPRIPATRTALGVTPQSTAVPDTLRVSEIIELVCAHYANPIPPVELLQRFEIADLAGKQSGALSGGQKRRLMVALALLGRPRLVILDEPTTGLDTVGRDTLWRELAEYRATGGTSLITSHYLAEIEVLATRVVVIDAGTVVADGSLEQIRGRVNVRRIRLRTNVNDDLLTALPNVTGVDFGDHDVDHRSRTATLPSVDADATVRALVTSEIGFCDLQVQPASLEEALTAITGNRTPQTTEREAS